MKHEREFSSSQTAHTESRPNSAETLAGPQWALVWEELKAHARKMGWDEDAYVEHARGILTRRSGELAQLIAEYCDKQGAEVVDGQ